MQMIDLRLLGSSDLDHAPSGAGHPFQPVARWGHRSDPHALDRLVTLVLGHEHNLIAGGRQAAALLTEDSHV